MGKRNLALYVHWPFCRSKCPYCDFNSHVREQVEQERWKSALLQELAFMAARLPGRRLTSIFFGGGTPSLMPPATVAAVIDAAVGHWPPDEDIEITLEANPTSVEAASFNGFRAAGVNRVSLGVQALNAEDLRFLGRHHSVEEALAAVALAAAIFPRYSFDLIYARPRQSVSAWETELREALNHAGDHLSLYQLTIEENTAFHHAYHREKRFVLPVDEAAAEMYEVTQSVMDAAGLPAYEISNHARPGQESRHNLAYWQGREYAGIGPGAHGRVRFQGAGVRGQEEGFSLCAETRHLTPETCIATQTLKSPERWLEAVEKQGHGLEIQDALEAEIIREEMLMMLLRLTAPIEKPRLMSLADPSGLARALKSGLIAETDAHYQTTLKGRLLLNYLTGELVG